MMIPLLHVFFFVISHIRPEKEASRTNSPWMRNIEQLGEAFGASKGSLQLTYGKLVGGDWNMVFMTFQKQLGMECHHPN